MVKAVIVPATAAGVEANAQLEELQPTARTTELRLVNPYHKPSLIHDSWTAGIPVLAIGEDGFPPLLDLAKDMQLDVACVACFPRRLPTILIEAPQLGFLNVHPSLLPRYRGPAPLFWLFREDDVQHRGVTIHQMDEGLDTGPVVRQEPITFANGLDQAAIERLCGQVGGRLLHEAIYALSRGVPAESQPASGSYHPWPRPDDFRLNSTEAAQEAFNFMRATDGFSMNYRLSLPDQELRLTEALHVEPDGSLDGTIKIAGTSVQVQFSSVQFSLV